MHIHPPKPQDCAHELKYCAECDKAYCEKCKKEWGNYLAQAKNNYAPFIPSYPSTPIHPNISPPWTVVCKGH